MEAKKYMIEDIAQILQAQKQFYRPDANIAQLVIDSRRINDPSNALFFAISAQKDGHNYLAEAYQKKIRNFVVEHKPPAAGFEEANFLIVPNTLRALQRLAFKHRTLFHHPIIGITGSNGKTIVKEWLHQLLAHDYSIIRNPRSWNSQIGVALSLWEMNPRYDLGIFEAGISKPGEMQILQQMIQPSIGVLTNIGQAHDEGFTCTEQKLQEKIKLFQGTEWVVARYQDVANIALADAQIGQFITWGRDQNATCYLIQEEIKDANYYFKARWKGEEISGVFPFNNQASIENCMTCFITLLAMGMDTGITLARIASLQPVRMRMELKPGINRCSIIDDSYSADLASLSIALDFLNQQNQHPQKCIILSDLVETGRAPKALYTEIGELLKSKNIHRIVGIGENISKHADLFDIPIQTFANTKTFLSQFNTAQYADESILIKGARKFGFEQISKLLVLKSHDTVLEINLEAMTHNLNFYRAQLNRDVKIMAMVKAFSYGSGSFEIANLLQFNKVDYLAVAYADEGVALIKAGIRIPVMVMSPEPSAFNSLIENQLEPELYSLEVLKSFLDYLPPHSKSYPVHLKLDTGMHRLGFEAKDDLALLELIANCKKIHIVSIFTHLAGSGNPDLKDFTLLQMKQFQSRVALMEQALGYAVVKHILNTSGIINYPAGQMDMVRLGIGLYGHDAALPPKRLQTVATLKTTVTQVKELSAEETVGYDRLGKLNRAGKVATVRIGYADGYGRAFGHGVGKMLINGVEASTIGSICMDMCMLDVTNMDVKAGDEVVVFNDTLTIETLAAQIHTIPYEILTNVSQRVKRVYFYE